MRALLITATALFFVGCWGDIQTIPRKEVPFEAKGKETKELLIELEQAPPEKAKKYEEFKKLKAEASGEAEAEAEAVAEPKPAEK